MADRPDDIPEDVFDIAAIELGGPGIHVHINSYGMMRERLARAILAERERCAKVAETYYDHVPDALRDAEDVTLVAAQNGIAAAIRAPGIPS